MRLRIDMRVSFINSILLFIATLTLACANSAKETKPAAGPWPASTTISGQSDKASRTTSFDGERAFSHVKAQVEMGPRPAGSAAIEKARGYVVRELNSYGLKTTLDEFTGATPRGKVKFKNVIADVWTARITLTAAARWSNG